MHVKLGQGSATGACVVNLYVHVLSYCIGNGKRMLLVLQGSKRNCSLLA